MKTEIEFLNQTSYLFQEAFESVLKAIDQLETQQLWIRPSTESNSVGIIVQHSIEENL